MSDGLRRLGGLITGRLLPKVAYPVVRGPLRGARLVLGAAGGKGGGASLFLGMFEPHQVTRFTQVVQPGQVLFDIGANVGFYSLLGSRLVGATGSVVAFEPVIRNLSYLYRHVSMNRCGNVSVLAAACSDEAGLASFAVASNVGEGHLETAAAVSGRSATVGRALVPTVTADSVAEKIGSMPDVMKVDVEGAEMEVLRGAKRILGERGPRIFLSIHSDELRTSCLELLKGYGYGAEPMEGSAGTATEYLMRRA